jgi:hypothetical protein
MPEDLDLQPVGQSLTGHEDLDLQPVAEDLDLQPVAEPGGTPGKAWMSAAAGAADTVAGVGRGLKVPYGRARSRYPMMRQWASSWASDRNSARG